MILKFCGHVAVSNEGAMGVFAYINREMRRMAPSQQQPSREAPPGDTVWTVLDAASDLGDTLTVEACRRVIDATFRGQEATASDMAIVAAFFG